MAAYIQIIFHPVTVPQSELLVALLSETGTEGFEEDENSLKAYIPEHAFIEAELKEISVKAGINFTTNLIAETNWNHVWESNFEPVAVEDFVALRADFHSPVPGVLHDIIITPKMSFGTGHHATTYMMLLQMREIDFNGKQVFDFGTGTGILAILAAKLGAASVLAIDIDDWSIENAEENIQRNQVHGIVLKKADSANMNQQFDHILANINKHIILENMESLAGQLRPGGALLLSGLLVEDQADILASANRCGLRLQKNLEKHNWLCMKLSY